MHIFFEFIGVLRHYSGVPALGHFMVYIVDQSDSFSKA